MRARPSTLATAMLLLAAVAGMAPAAVAQTPPDAAATTFAASIQPLLERFCYECHATDVQKGDLDLEQFTSVALVRQQPAIWQAVQAQLADAEMPPQKALQPAAAEREQLRAWVAAMLEELAAAHAGDPGPVVLRRLGNAEYTYAIRDLTGVDALDPAREFPVDGAAGEGFTNVGNALVMSPMLLGKYLAAGKAIAEHAVLLPDGLRFAAATSRRDQTEELLAAIRAIYRRYSDPNGAERVDLQGIVFATNDGGRLPLASYLQAALDLRDARPDAEALATAATARGLSPKYLTMLWQALTAQTPALLLDDLRAAFRSAAPAEVAPLTAAVTAWQQRLWQFRTVGHIGKVGGPTAWLEPLSPLVTSHELRCPLPPTTAGEDVTLHLVAHRVDDGAEPVLVVWQQPRLVAPGRPDLSLRDLRGRARALAARQAQIVASLPACLAAAAEVADGERLLDTAALASKHGVAAELLAAWLDALGLRPDAAVAMPMVEPLTDRVPAVGGQAAVSAWSRGEQPSVVANASDQLLRIPGTLLPHSVAVHPTPELRALVAWQSPQAARLRIQARIQHAHTACGNGVTWAVELRRGALRLLLGSGLAVDGEPVLAVVADGLQVHAGDRIAVVVGPRERDHRCDLTAIDLTLDADGGPQWHLARDVAADLLAGNPHADGHGNAGVWHFGCEPDLPDQADAAIPAGSLLARWLRATTAAERRPIAIALQALAAAGAAGAGADDARLHRQWFAGAGALYRGIEHAAPTAPGSAADRYGLDPAQFGRLADGRDLASDSLAVPAPTVLAVRVPAELAAGRELVAVGEVAAGDGAVQFQVLTTPPPAEPRLVAGPVTAPAGSAAAQQLAAAFAAFRALFPPALCYEQIVPVDEVVTLTLFHREDTHLVRLMLDAAEAAELDRLWAELHFVSQDALTLVDVFEQLWQYATQDGDPKVFEPLREPIRQRAAAFRSELAAAAPHHVEAVLEFADRAWRRALTAAEADELRALYQRLRAEAMPHEPAIRLLLARVLVAPAFLYRSEQPAAGAEPAAVTADELATRLSFLLWSSVPDPELRACAASGRLLDPDVLVAQARRLLAHPRARRLAVEFACTWLQLRDFDLHAEKSERHFPQFADLRAAMYEEAIRYCADLLQRDGSVLELLDGDHTFVNGPLAEHYGIPDVTGPEWRRVDGIRQYGRGGVLGFAAVLASQSGASRTSPILRGNWLAEVLLGERLPRPPKDVPKLPEDEADQALTMRELVERHRRDPRCAHCHDRIDPFGFALEGFDAIGRRREHDLGGRPIDARATTRDGTMFTGLDGLRDHLLHSRRAAFLRQFSRKLLGYALGRAVQLGDEPLLQSILEGWPASGHRFSWLLERILRSEQFLRVRGRDHRDAGRNQ